VSEAPLPGGILNGVPIPQTVETPMEGVWAWTNPRGWRVVALHHSADPDKRAGTEQGNAWIDFKRKDLSDRDWKREMDMDHTIAEGDPFYATFNRSLHVRRCTYDRSLPLLRGWDFGRVHPAIVFAQKDHRNKLKILWSHIYSNLTIYQLVPIILAETNTRFPKATVRDYGDPSGAQETDKGATTVILLQTFKIELVHRFSYVETGAKMIDKKLLLEEDGTPGLWSDFSNTELNEGFESGYVIDTTASGKDTEGRAKNSPRKDGWYDHVMDALRYIVVNVYSVLADDAEDKKRAWESVSLWRTNAEHATKTAELDPLEDFNL